MKILKALGLAALMAVSATASKAAIIYATSVDSYTMGTNTMAGGSIAANRLVQSNALGAADGNFLSLGLGGEAILSFGQLFTSPVSVLEITNGNRNTHLERVEVYGGLGGVFTLLGTITNSVMVNTLGVGGKYDQLKLVDLSPANSNRDGWDLDAVWVTTVIPVPAGGLLLITALGLVAMLRRKSA